MLEEILCDDKGDLDPDCGVVCCGVVLEASRAFRVNRFHVEGEGEGEERSR